VELPGGGLVSGMAVDIDPDGCLLVDTGTGIFAVAAGDVIHVRNPPA
jgi:BirA family transcriptional regulator, biotin operon repressor / biotin---[acetyl-CoA-carboxylase] ligase